MLKHETHLPVIVDPSHAAGRRDLVLPLARAAVAAGADGIIVEVHPRPEEALCDGPQQIPTAEFADFAREIGALVELLGKTHRVSRGGRAARHRRHGPDRRVRRAGRAAGRASSACAAATPTSERSRARSSAARSTRRGALAAALGDADLAVVAAPVARLAAPVADVLDGERDGGTVTDVGSTKARRLRGALGDAALRRRPSGLRLRGARARARDAPSSSTARPGS